MSTMFDWSTPARREGSLWLDPIPVEIYQEIFGYFQQNDDMSLQELRRSLANIALVCRFFSAMALPKLFAQVIFSGAGGRETSRTARFCQALNQDQELAKRLGQYVRTCIFTSWVKSSNDDDTLAMTRDALLSMYCTALAKMTSVETIAFHSISIDKRVLKAIKKLGLLQSLSFSRCSIDPGLDLNHLTTFLRGLHLRSLVIFCGEASQIQTFQNVISSALSLQTLTTLEVDSWPIIQRLVDLDTTLPLQTLTIHHVQDPAVLPTLFCKTPQLLHLHIYTILFCRENVVTSIQFPKNTLPRLSFFDGPSDLAISLVPSRPISKVWLAGTLARGFEHGHWLPILPELTHQMWEVLAKAKGTVKELLIPKHLYYVGCLSTYLPDVNTLKISWSHANWRSGLDLLLNTSERVVEDAIRDLCVKWPPNPSVCQLVLELTLSYPPNFALLNLQSQHEILQDVVVKAFPNIEQVNFVTYINWRRSPLDNAWRAEIPKAKQGYLWAFCKRDKDQLIDHDYRGCFENLFDSNSPDFMDYEP